MGYDIPDNIDLSELGAPETSSDQSQPVAPSAFDPNLEITYKASGRELKEPLSTVIQRASRGYDYAQLVAQHKAEVAQTQAQWQAKQQELAAMEQQWKPYHEYASQNPQWADFVRQQWESRFNSQQQPAFDPMVQQPSANLPPELQRELSELRQFADEIRSERQLARQAEQDAALNNEIDSVKKAFPDIDFQHTDPETGESLEFKVLRHAQEKQIHNFAAAFKDFYFDKLMERNVMKAKEDVAKQMQSQFKQGFLAKGNQPMLQNDGSAPNVRGMSYHQLADIAIKEMGIG